MNRNALDGLIAFRTVARRRSFTAAADELGVSPPAVSKIVRQLERRLGAALLIRTTRSTHLTEAGERLLAQAEPALEQLLAAMDDLKSYAQAPAGTLRLNLPRFSYAAYLAPRIASFVGKHPAVTLELYFQDEATDVVADGFDAGIRDADILAKDMVATRLFGPIRFVIVGSPAYFARAGRPRQPADLLAHDCIRARVGKDWIYDRWEFEQKGKPLQVQVKGSLIMNDAALSLTAAADGLGLAYATEDLVHEQVAAGKLEIVLGAWAARSEGYYLYYPRGSEAQPKLRAFIEHVRQTRPRRR